MAFVIKLEWMAIVIKQGGTAEACFIVFCPGNFFIFEKAAGTKDDFLFAAL